MLYNNSPNYRGKGLNQILIKVLNYYSNSNYNKLIAITGANNGSYIDQL